MIFALGIAFLSGYVALSYEILWFRAFSFTSGSAAPAFGLMLGAYLLGLALGALAVRRACRDTGEPARALQMGSLFLLTLTATLAGFFVVPVLAWMVSQGLAWRYALPCVGIAAAGLGSVFPLTTHLAVEPDEGAGRKVSYIYLANILGSTLGSLLTGFIVMDHLSLGGAHVLLLFLGLGMSLLLLLRRGGSSPVMPAALIGAVALAAALAGKVPFESLYEKLQLKGEYTPARRFSDVVENRSGVITVNEIGQVFGGGIYDGAYNTGLREDKNAIIRCYSLAEMRPVTPDVLEIGLSSGSWATVLANNPSVQRLTILEINPGYLRLIPKYPEVAGLLKNPKVTIEIDDARRWLIRNPHRKFDAIVSNSSHHWRSNATNLLSEDFLRLIRSHLKEGGCFYYNTTDSFRVLKTGCSIFPHSLRVGSFLAVSDAPLQLDLDRLRERLFDYPLNGGTVFDRNSQEDRKKADRVFRILRTMVLPRDRMLASFPAGLPTVTDDNMGTEWSETP
jgi:spermidine synthase